MDAARETQRSHLYVKTGTMEPAAADCYLCGSRTLETLFSVGEFSVVRCRRCALRFSCPSPRPGALLALNLKNRVCYEKQPRSRLHAYLKTKIMEVDGAYPKAGLPRAIIGRLLPRRFMPEVVPWIPGGRILDVGFGHGGMLDWLKDHRWETWGIDFARDAVEKGVKKGHHAVQADVERDELDSLPREYFDVIRLSHVLEHLRDPVGALLRLKPLLRPTGLLIVSIPNLESESARTLGRHCTMLNIPRHLYFFSVTSLETILGRAGFKVFHRKGKDSLEIAAGGLRRLRRSQGCMAAGRAIGHLVCRWPRPKRPLDSFDLITFHASLAHHPTGEEGNAQRS